MSTIFFYYPDAESNNYSQTNTEFSLFSYEKENKKIMVDEGVQTEPKIIEQDKSPEKDYKFLKEETKKNNNEFLSKKRK